LRLNSDPISEAYGGCSSSQTGAFVSGPVGTVVVVVTGTVVVGEVWRYALSPRRSLGKVLSPTNPSTTSPAFS
jgi:hypothetical protein